MSKAPIRVKFSPPVRTIMVTGGAGFIGSAVCRALAQDASVRVINLDKLSYAASPDALSDLKESATYRLVQGDIADRVLIAQIMAEEHVSAVMHLAAESHVDRSIEGPAVFIETNITGTFHLLEVALAHWQALPPRQRPDFRFHHISTDEVFGDLPFDGSQFSEKSRYKPSSPYSASKAASDHLVRAWHHTFGLPVVLSNCSNNYGPHQHPEKLIPLTILNALAGRPLPIYGTGANVRDWLYVDDHARALNLVLRRGQVGETYLVGGRAERSNIGVVAKICDLLDRIEPRPDGRKHRSLIQFVTDRAGHDRRYAIDPTKIERELGWRPQVSFDDGLLATIDWYRAQGRGGAVGAGVARLG